MCKTPSTSIEVIVELDFFDVISLKVFHNSLGFPLFLVIKSDCCSELPDKQNRKAVFSAASMKLLSNVQSGKYSKEWLTVERFSVPKHFNIEVVHAVISLVHDLVYTCVHLHTWDRKVIELWIQKHQGCVPGQTKLFRHNVE